jgi:peptide/nickel transport system permease protein
MIVYLVRRLALAVSMVWAVSFAAFVAFGLALDPTWQFALCPTANVQCREERAALIERFHLHAPILERYWYWFSGLFQHGFGNSTIGFYQYGPGYPIGPTLWHATWVTAQLLGVSLLLVVIGSVVVGVVSSRLPGSPLDWLLRLTGYVAWSMPAFLLGVILVHVFATTGWFDIAHSGRGFVSWLRWISLPAIALALGLIGLYSRYIRTAMLDNLNQQYAEVARGKGLSENRVAFRHVLRNSLIPTVSLLSLEFAAIIGASLAIDYVFGLGGLAGLFLHAISQADPFVLTAILVVIAAVVAVSMFLADLSLGALDPRLRTART